MKIRDEFQSFVMGPQAEPPELITQSIFKFVKAAMQPSVWLVFGKLVRIHVFAGAFTLFFCPQFGVNPWGGMGLMHIFSKGGHSLCACLCGALFLGVTSLVARVLLNSDELRVARRAAFWQMTLLGTLSIAVLMLLGQLTANPLIPSAHFILYWVFGAVGVGILVMLIPQYRRVVI